MNVKENYILNELELTSQRGNMYITKGELLRRCKYRNCMLDMDSFESDLDELIQNKKIVVSFDRIYLSRVYEAQKIIEEKIEDVLRTNRDKIVNE